MKIALLIALFGTATVALAQGSSAPSTTPNGSSQTEPFAAWARQHAIPIANLESLDAFADLEPLQAMIGQARIVALGEGAHNKREFLAFRNRMIAFLVRELGLTAVAFETGFAEGIEVDDYIQGGAGDSNVIAKNVFSWNPNGLDENRILIEWLRTHNARVGPNQKIQFYGVDLTGGRNGRFTHARRAIDEALAYIHRVDAPLGQQLRIEFEPLLPKFNDRDYFSLSPGERRQLTAAIAALVSVFPRRRLDFLEQTTELDYARAYRHAVVAGNIDTVFRVLPGPLPSNQKEVDAFRGDGREYFNTRDAAMADNLGWVLAREGKRGRILTFAHNGHVRKSLWQKEPFPHVVPNKPTVAMGQFVHSAVSQETLVIGCAFKPAAEGQKLSGQTPGLLDADSIAAGLAQVGLPRFVLDLRAVPKTGIVADWLDRSRALPVDGGKGELRVREAFDALVFFDAVNNARPVQKSPDAAK